MDEYMTADTELADTEVKAEKIELADIQNLPEDELTRLAEEMNIIEDGASLKRRELLSRILRAYSERNGSIQARGILAIANDGYGFLRSNSGQQGSGDVYVSQSQIRRFGLRTGDEVGGQVRPPKDGERYFGLVRVELVNGLDADKSRNRPNFEGTIVEQR